RAHLETMMEKARLCVSSGVPISGCEIRVVTESGEDLAERCVGEIAVRSVSLFEGYRNNPEKTAEVFRLDCFLLATTVFCTEANALWSAERKTLSLWPARIFIPKTSKIS